MKNRNIFILNSVLFTISWLSCYYYQLHKADTEEEAVIIEYYYNSENKLIK